VRDLTGVRGVTNAITIKPSASSSDVAQRSKEAPRRRAELDASKIEVETIDGTVTLNGTVRNWPERADAESAVWAAPGVIRVEDRLTVRH
jgi:osmotically-inducible protein OsmY